MFFVIAGTLGIVLKFLEVSPVADWPWWVVLAPFGLAVAWWTFSDASGLTKRREMEKMENRKEERRRKALDALGIDPQRKGRDKRV